MSDMELYSHYFPVGKKVGVGIPLPNADVFRDWAIIHEIDEDLVSLQLSRDILPVGISLNYGSILELRCGSEENGYCCRAIVVSEGDAHELLLRLIGEIVSDELREFYRIDAYLPIKYFVSREQNIERLRKEWQERRINRLQQILDKKNQRWKAKNLPEGMNVPHEHPHESVEGSSDEPVHGLRLPEDEPDSSWDTIIPLAANISGGGLRIITHQGFEVGEYALMEIFVPSPERVIDVVGRVVFANRNFATGSDHEFFNTGVHFVYLDERDRDAIVNYISTIQLKRIRQLREKYMFRRSPGDDDQINGSTKSSIRLTVARMVLLMLSIAIVSSLVSYYWYYAHEHPKGEIQRTFEDSVRKYRQQQKPN
jgi:hypothetical protein